MWLYVAEDCGLCGICHHEVMRELDRRQRRGEPVDYVSYMDSLPGRWPRRGRRRGVVVTDVLAALTGTGATSWREAEERIFHLTERLRLGVIPEPDGLPEPALRRLGCLAEVALTSLEPVNPSGLRRLVTEIRAMLPDTPVPREDAVPLVPYPSRPTHWRDYEDDRCRAWGIGPDGFDLTRWSVEIVSIRAVQEHGGAG